MILRGINIGKAKIKEVVINIISARRLIDGGAAIFIALTRNHIMDIDGRITSMPLLRIILRELVRS